MKGLADGSNCERGKSFDENQEEPAGTSLKFPNSMPEEGTRSMDRIAHKANGFEEAAEWDIRQQLSMTPKERRHAARKLKERAFPADAPDVREWHKTE